MSVSGKGLCQLCQEVCSLSGSVLCQVLCQEVCSVRNALCQQVRSVRKCALAGKGLCQEVCSARKCSARNCQERGSARKAARKCALSGKGSARKGALSAGSVRSRALIALVFGESAVPAKPRGSALSTGAGAKQAPSPCPPLTRSPWPPLPTPLLTATIGPNTTARPSSSWSGACSAQPFTFHALAAQHALGSGLGATT